MTRKPEKVHYPREVGSGRWQSRSGNTYDTWHKALRDVGPAAPPPVSDPTAKPRPKRRGLIILGLIVLGCCLLLVKADIWRSTGNRQLCGWAVVMIEAPAGAKSEGRAERGDCYVATNGVRASFRLFTISGDRVIDTNALQREYRSITEGASTPSADLSWAAVLSWPQLVWSNRLPMVVYENPDHRRGYILAPITDKIVVGGVYMSDRPESASSIQQALRLHLNPAGRVSWMSFWVKVVNSAMLIFLLIPLAIVGGSRSIFNWFDRWWNLQTNLGMILYCAIVPGFLLLWAFLFIRLSGWNTFSLVSLLLVPLGVGQVIFNLGRDRRSQVPLVPFDSPKLTVFQKLIVSSSEIDIAGAPIPAGKSVDLEMWFPWRAGCPACNLSYAVYVPSGANRPIPMTLTVNELTDIPLKTRQDLYTEAAQAAPKLANGCIRCGKPFEDTPASAPRKGPFPVNWITGLVAMLCLGVAVLIFTRSGAVIAAGESAAGIGDWLGEALGDFAGLVTFFLITPALYLLWRLFAHLADLNVSRGTALRRMSACPKEGIVFEDIHAARDMTCPSCGGEREAIRHFRVAGA